MSARKSLSTLIGVIGKPHGIKGYLYVRIFTDYPDDVCLGSLLFLDESCTKELNIEDKRQLVSKGSNRIILKFAGIDDRSCAENLRGNKLYKKTAGQHHPGNDSYLVQDLIGCKVYSPGNILFGIVIDVENYISNDNLVIKTSGIKSSGDRKNDIMIPMIGDYLAEIDTKNKIIILKKIPEYI